MFLTRGTCTSYSTFGHVLSRAGKSQTNDLKPTEKLELKNKNVYLKPNLALCTHKRVVEYNKKRIQRYIFLVKKIKFLIIKHKNK